MKTNKLREHHIDRGIATFIVRYSVTPDNEKLIHSILIDLKCGSEPQCLIYNQKEAREHYTKLLNLQDFVFFEDLYPHIYKEPEQGKGEVV